MKKTSPQQCLRFLACALAMSALQAFCPTRTGALSRPHILPRPLPTAWVGAAASTTTASTRSSRNTALAAGAATDGSDRGAVILGVVFLVCVWIFSIPPEFRRAYICSSDPCVENRASCNNCVTADEWKAGIADYYANGGGINFDFTVAQETKDLWAGK